MIAQRTRGPPKGSGGGGRRSRRGQLRLIGMAAMADAIGEARVHLLAAEVEIGLAGVADRPFADLVVEIEQASSCPPCPREGLAGTSRRGGAGVIGACCSPGRLAEEPARADRAQDRLRRRGRRGDGIGGVDLVVILIGRRDGCRGHRARERAARRARARGRRARAWARPARAPLPWHRARWACTGDGRDCRPSRCALPITALRLTPPSSSAIWLAVWPPSHIFLSVSIRSSVQAIQYP